MELVSKLESIWKNKDHPLLISDGKELFFKDIQISQTVDLNEINAGDVVVLIGDYNSVCIKSLFQLIDMKVIVAPITNDTKSQHKYFIEEISAKYVIENNKITRTGIAEENNKLINNLREADSAGFIFFSSGSSGKPKAILHNVNNLLKKYEKPRRQLKAVNFLMFDHLGGINTFLHIIFNCGTIIALENRNVKHVIDTCNKYQVQLLPTTPTFLRMLLLSGYIPNKIPESLKIITYGTESMDSHTLIELSRLLPNVQFRQTYGLSEFNAFRIKSESNNSLYFKFSDDVKYKVEKRILYLKSSQRMMGYINYDDPFDEDGWFKTNDLVDVKGEFLKIIGRNTDLINVGGLKFISKEVEDVALTHEKILNVKVVGEKNPITGQHVKIIIELKDKILDKKELMKFFKEKLPSHMVPHQIVFDKIQISTRFKKK